MSILHKQIVLVLNKNWQAINIVTPVQAFNQLCVGAATALHVDEDDIIGPVRLKDWMELPVREKDWSIGTPHGKIRVPVVIILSKFDKVPKKKLKFSRRAVYERDNGVDQYTGEYVPYENGNLDHVNPKSNGGEKDWSNIVWTAIETNSRKKNRTPEQAGLKLIRSPVIPKTETMVTDKIFNVLGIKEWDHFLKPGRRSTDLVKHTPVSKKNNVK